MLDYALEAYLNQEDDNGNLRSIMFYSRKLLLVQENYEVHDKELLVIVDTFKE